MLRTTMWLTLLMIMGALTGPTFAKKKKKTPPKPKPAYEQEAFEGLTFRGIGPFRGGRSAAVTGVPGKPNTYYFGGTGGGVWRTEDAGISWHNISDGFFGGSIGAVAVSTWDNNIIYVGGGEKTVRGNVSHGYGMWKSMDRGKTWKQVGLKDSRHIPRIRIHPKNPNLVYAAVMGHLYGPNEERGIFRSKDGGETWEKILFVNDSVGAVDLAMDPNNPRVLYASFWRVIRKPYTLESGGEGSGIWKSTDGGETWNEISRNKGLPKGTLGISGVSVSPVDSDRVWAIIEAEEGGVFRSDDSGETWNRVNSERSLRQRAWYYTRIYADTKDKDTVYVLNVRFWRSTDGGKTYKSYRTPHGDHHDLWIDPDDPNRMVVGDDGGAQVSNNGALTWSTYMNQPTSQFYRVSTDNHFPYRIYGAQQDNSTVRILHRTSGRVIDEDDWESTAGGESGHIAIHPDNPEIVYGGSYGGFLTRLDHETEDFRAINVWPDNPMGHGAAELEYRFQWNFPIFFSRHDSNILYTAGNVLFKTTNEGQSWEKISPDLTRNEKAMQGPSGGPITKDNTSVEYYSTIFAADESIHEKGVLWVGSDDGKIHISRDSGGNWTDITPPGMPEWMQINSIEPHPFEKGGLYVAGTRYKLDDFKPYLYKTLDYGQTWELIVEGIPEYHFTRVIRADHKRKGLLYAGTESGLYISFDDGAVWQSFQLNLPIVPITDLAWKNDDLIVATQGRSFWVMDDLTPIHQLSKEILEKDVHLFEARLAYRMGGFGGFGPPPTNAGQNLSPGPLINFYVKEWAKEKPAKTKEKAENGQEGDKAEKPKKNEMTLEILEADGTLIRKFSTSAKERDEKLTVKKGLNRFIWNMSYPDAEGFEGMIMWSGGLGGPTAVPGKYKARLTHGDNQQTIDFEIAPNPNSKTSADDYRKQFDFLISVRDKLSETHLGIKKIRKIKKAMNEVTGPMKGRDDYKEVVEAAKELEKKLTTIEETLYQTKNRSRQDPLNFPIRLNDRLSGLGLTGWGDHPPTDQAVAVRDMLVGLIDTELAKLDEIVAKDVPAFNELVKSKAVPAIWLTEDKTED